MLKVIGFLGEVAVEAVVGQGEAFDEGHDLLGEGAFAADGEGFDAVLLEQRQQFRCTAAQLLLDFGRRPLAVEREEVEPVGEAVEGEDEVLVALAAVVEGGEFLFAERQVALGALVAVEEDEVAFVLARGYGLEFVGHCLRIFHI